MSTTINYIFFFFFLSPSILIQSINSSSSQTSRLFLQPFPHPNKSISPSTSPSPSPSPSPRPRKHKHEHNYPSNLFFPSDPSPPPSAANSIPIFPANISSPTLSNTTSSNSSAKLIAVVISLAVFLLVVIAVAGIIIFRHHRQKNTDTKVDRSDSIRLYPPNTSVSDSKSPRLLPFDSPELRPLPPLPKNNLSGKQYYYNTAYEGTREDEFFSPIGFSGSPNAAVSSSGSVTGAEIFRSRSLNSEISSYPSSRSASYSGTTSRCPSIASNSTTSINFPATLQPQELKILTESPPPQRNSAYTHHSDEIVSYGSGKLPPIPPSLPPPRFSKMWQQIQGSPELEIPAKPRAELQNSGKNNEFGETSAQNVKSKLKALHWDKVRASSDRAMVWDKLKSTSFQ